MLELSLSLCFWGQWKVFWERSQALHHDSVWQVAVQISEPIESPRFCRKNPPKRLHVTCQVGIKLQHIHFGEPSHGNEIAVMGVNPTSRLSARKVCQGSVKLWQFLAVGSLCRMTSGQEMFMAMFTWMFRQQGCPEKGHWSYRKMMSELRKTWVAACSWWLHWSKLIWFDQQKTQAFKVT